MKEKFKFLSHTGDIKFRAYGKTLEDTFNNCALAISSIFSRGKKIKPLIIKNFSIECKDNESLIYKLIEELIYFFDAENFIVSKTEVKIDNLKANITVYGDKTSNYLDLDAIKSPTYAEMYIKKKVNLWEAQIVVDV